jgi:hypothetical protein
MVVVAAELPVERRDTVPTCDRGELRRSIARSPRRSSPPSSRPRPWLRRPGSGTRTPDGCIGDRPRPP